MLKNLSWRQLVRSLSRLGFTGPFSGGRHSFMIKGDLKLHIPNPHRGDISKELIREILRQAGISLKDWDSLR
jgi:predicted RNA binding protein YcfA (HicA-like mRNA interferase family)